MNHAKSITIAVLVVLLAACGKNAVKSDEAVSEPVPASSDSTHGAAGSSDVSGTDLTPEEARMAGLLQQVTIYFDYDASDIRGDARSALDAKLPILRANSGVQIRISGHADERGSDQYNDALGQRRAASTKRYLTDNGIDAARITIVSYGEQRPAANGTDENAWSRNRRAEFEITAGGNNIVPPQ